MPSRNKAEHIDRLLSDYFSSEGLPIKNFTVSYTGNPMERRMPSTLCHSLVGIWKRKVQNQESYRRQYMFVFHCH